MRITGSLLEEVCTFTIMSRLILTEMRNVSEKSCRENQNKYLIENNFFSECRTVCELTWDNMVESNRI